MLTWVLWAIVLREVRRRQVLPPIRTPAAPDTTLSPPGGENTINNYIAGEVYQESCIVSQLLLPFFVLNTKRADSPLISLLQIHIISTSFIPNDQQFSIRILIQYKVMEPSKTTILFKSYWQLINIKILALTISCPIPLQWYQA